MGNPIKIKKTDGYIPVFLIFIQYDNIVKITYVIRQYYIHINTAAIVNGQITNVIYMYIAFGMSCPFAQFTLECNDIISKFRKEWENISPPNEAHMKHLREVYGREIHAASDKYCHPGHTLTPSDLKRMNQYIFNVFWYLDITAGYVRKPLENFQKVV